jgi:chemotaxis protein methyltransferase CheR
MKEQSGGVPRRRQSDKISFLHNPISETEFFLFQKYIAEESGIMILPEKAYIIETRLAKLMLDSGTDSFLEFYRYIQSNTDPLIKQKIINAITINETLWFRDGTPWKVLEEKLLPVLVKELLSGKRTAVRFWHSAVSTGQEAYSAAMCVDNYLRKHRVKGVSLSNFNFFATDISSRALEIAKKGRYDMISMMRGMNDTYKAEYFIQDGSAWTINPKIHDAVSFELFNLRNDYSKFGIFDIVFCRYVLIYFSDELKRETISKMAGTLADNGVLFTGNYALYELFKDAFDLNHYGNLTYYTKKAVIK